MRNFFRSPLAVISAAIVLAFVVIAVFAPAIAPYDPAATNLRARLAPPAWVAGGTTDHILGTDVLGRDLLSRVIHGARVALIVGLGGVTVTLVIGVILGLVAGFLGGLVDTIVMRAVDMMLAVPNILLYLTVLIAFPPSVTLLILVIGFINWTTFARVVRAEVLALKRLEFIEAAHATGQKKLPTVWRHILPNVTGPIIAVATVSVASVIVLESSLSFLGLGPQAPTVTWGRILADGRDYLSTAWWIGTFPGISITVLCLALILLGDWLRLALDPRQRSN